MQQPEKKKKERRITTTRKQSFSLFQWVKKEIYKTAIISEFGAIMDKYMSIYGVIPICRPEVLPHFSRKTKTYQFLFLIAGFLIFQKILIFGCFSFLSDLHFFSWSQFPDFPDNLSFRWSLISVPVPNSGFPIFQTILVVVVATILRNPAVVFLQSARNQ